MKDMCWVLHHLYPKCPADFFLLGSRKHSPWYAHVPLSPYGASGVSKPQAENEATRILQQGAERGPELERQIIALVDFIGSKSLWRDIEDRKILCLLQVAGLAALEIGSTLQWDYEENGKLQDEIVLKFEGKKKK